VERETFRSRSHFRRCQEKAPLAFGTGRFPEAPRSTPTARCRRRPAPTCHYTHTPAHRWWRSGYAQFLILLVFQRLLRDTRTVPDEGFLPKVSVRHLSFRSVWKTSAHILKESERARVTSSLPFPSLGQRSIWPCHCNSMVSGKKPSRTRSAPTFAHVPPSCLLSYASV
jgi:hypothetical protein